MKSCFTGKSDPYIDPVFSITSRFHKSTNPNKVNLGVGAYRDHDGKSRVLNVVKMVELELAQDKTQNKDYLNMGGLDSFVSGTLRLLFGDNCEDIQSGRIQGVQSISGTGACKLAFDLLNKYHNITCFYYPDPTWPIHVTILKFIGVKDARTYKYYDQSTSELDWNAITSTLNAAPPGAAVILHACGHNPTGMDFSTDQWKVIADILIERNLIPIIDIAYLGFVSGCIDTDAYPVRLFHSLGKEMLFCVSYAKNMGLYNERVGVLGWFAPTKEVSDGIKDRLCFTIRNTYSSPPAHGAKVASRIINDQKLTEEWKTELRIMSNRVSEMRHGLLDRLVKLKTPGDWSFIIKQKGLFSYTGLSVPQIKHLEEKYHLFMLATGRINVSALTNQNIDLIANAIHDAVLNIE